MTLACALAASAASAQVYKCTDAQGKASYQQQPCSGSGSTLQTKTDAQPADPKPASPAQPMGNSRVVFPKTSPLTEPPGTNPSDKPAWRPRNSFEASFTGLVSAKRACDHFRPGFAARTDADYQRWRQRHAGAIQAVETDPAYLKWRGDQPRLLQSPSMYESEGECEKYADLFAIRGALPDPQRATPQQAWTAFVKGVDAGDVAYLRRTTMGMVSYNLQQQTDDGLSALRVYVKGAGSLDIEAGPTASTGRVRRDDGVTLDVSLIPHESNWYVAVIEIAQPR